VWYESIIICLHYYFAVSMFPIRGGLFEGYVEPYLPSYVEPISKVILKPIQRYQFNFSSRFHIQPTGSYTLGSSL
jgi:hypothetical protein